LNISLAATTVAAGEHRLAAPTAKSHQLKGRKRTMMARTLSAALLLIGVASSGVSGWSVELFHSLWPGDEASSI
jgi:hypothetical protein